MNTLLLLSLILMIGFSLGRLRTQSLLEHRGETVVRRLLVSKLHDDEFHLLNNITLKTEDGTTQIDHILVSTRGVFVIETKSHSHWIFVNEKSKKWTQILPGGLKFGFQNPIRQNYKHLMAVRGLLDFLPEQVFIPLVVFTGQAKFKTARPKGVLYSRELVSFIKSHPNGALSLNRVAFSVGKIECARMQITRKTDLEHQAHLEKKFGRLQ
ncbi:MAG: nuclease-related domain-containing protein [Pseudomonadales bacterium]|nr:nuclease-related domain-containing protein [Pseudomonadales bacterium]